MLWAEYNGDILWQTHAHHRVQIQNYRHLNYWFTLNETVDRSVKHIVDAMRAGNPTMYINHALGMAQNVVSKVIDVNSEHRIGLFAAKKIPVGKELLLDYGPNYFRLDDDDSADNIPEDPGNLSSPPSHK
ncbi:hypothetical protein GLOTRDRAFT_131077 [Gloeophyllum trabeum ATCC 11539]|uniref:SET domain-containing protein n=1 Tax=Gloeophyllum trabeum (strain ATCC 11539 / FP-39264 / Madison 617) TaxID=670483 RepID=S7RHG9_GLOTA|nr:uncharacterized protein GLOTRDRAFT_131077 [Gloeophyllum trabeum ATCC 11539]EPQ53740.1 hypothetical protein GLOTRDRAFT_131077 [Gloeophyllum trabeum ATCC 11539]